jgi:hypothetical protein
MRSSLLLILLLLAGCATTGASLPDSVERDAPMVVMPVRNLSGVPLKIPSIYFGDAVGKGADLEIENVDLALLAEAAVYTHLDVLGYRVELQQNADKLGAEPHYQVHAAVTDLDMTELRRTGRFRMGIVVMLVDAEGQFEITRGEADQEYQLIDVAPDEAGALGTKRFIEGRLQSFTEGLAREAVDSAGF